LAGSGLWGGFPLGKNGFERYRGNFFQAVIEGFFF
jgi:hypothetical protein